MKPKNIEKEVFELLDQARLCFKAATIGPFSMEAKDRTVRRDWRDVLLELTGVDPGVCPVCGGQMALRLVYGRQFTYGLPP